jgi:hypothetical protein
MKDRPWSFKILTITQDDCRIAGRLMFGLFDNQNFPSAILSCYLLFFHPPQSWRGMGIRGFRKYPRESGRVRTSIFTHSV